MTKSGPAEGKADHSLRFLGAAVDKGALQQTAALGLRDQHMDRHCVAVPTAPGKILDNLNAAAVFN